MWNSPYASALGSVLHVCGGRQVWLRVAAQLLVGHDVVPLTEPCECCGQRFVQHACAGTGHAGHASLLPVVRQSPPAWLPILEATVRAACPQCGIAMDLADTIANDPAASAREQEVAAEFKKGAMALGVVVIGLAALNWAAGDSTEA